MLISPELDLLRQTLRRDGFCRFAVYDKAAFPLGAGDEKDSNASLLGQLAFDSLHVRFLPGKTHAGTGVDTPLEHLKSVVLEPLAEVVCRLALGLGSDWQIECDDQPAHFEFFCIHGL